jgi:hypothetical protein
MSKPTVSYFCIHTGYYRNDRTLALKEIIGDKAFHVMPMLWSWAGEQQMDGKIAHLSIRRYQEIFQCCNLRLSIAQVARIIGAVRQVGFIQNGKLHSWDKYNRHAVDYEKRQGIKRDAAFARWKEKVKAGPGPAQGNGPGPAQGNGPGPAQGNGPGPAQQRLSPSQQLWLIDKALVGAKGSKKRTLERQREQLLSAHTGVDLSEPAAPPRHTGKAPKSSPGAFEHALLASARQLASDDPDLLTEQMVTSLVNAGDDLPARIKSKFRKLLEQLGDPKNPVPG